VRSEVLWLILVFGSASLICRISGFWLMRFVTITPRLEASLKAVPLAVMIGIVVPTAFSGKPLELLALALIIVMMRLTKSDLLSAAAGVAVIATGRWLQLAT
jgi:uncharacterized membrane protein